MYANNWDGTLAPGVNLTPQTPLIQAGPCQLESLELGLEVATFLRDTCQSVGLPYIFKASYDKANRTSKGAARGPGLKLGLEWLATIREKLGVPVLTDVHTPEQALEAGQVVDVLQIPAYISNVRETLVAAAKSGKPIQIKKGQHHSPEDCMAAAQFLNDCKNNRVLLCERGSCFGYNNLVVDMRNLCDFRRAGYAVSFDATHAAQLPGAASGGSSGLRHVIPTLARAGVAAGVDALFMEVHPQPEKAKSDASTQLDFATAQSVIREAAAIAKALATFKGL